MVAKSILGDSVRNVVECGARDCAETLAFHELLPQAEIYAFECNPDTLPLCRNTIGGIDKIHLVECAVSDKAGLVTFFKIDPNRTRTTWLDGNPGASSLFLASGNYPVEDYAQTAVTVTAVTLSDFMVSAGLETIDLLWMDIQGAELLALEGLGSSISRVKIIHLEVEFIEVYLSQPLWPDVYRFLKERGFLLLTFTTFGKYSADAVFINSSLASVRKRLIPDWFVYYKFLYERKLGSLSRRIRRIVSWSE
jgi:FkbM family methyltransferase